MLSFGEFLRIYSELEEYTEGIKILAYELYKEGGDFDIDFFLEKYDKGEFDDGISEYTESLI